MAGEPQHEEPDRPLGPENQNVGRQFSLIGIGFEFLASVCLFGLIGWWADGRLHTFPWLLIAGVGLGFAAGLMMMIRAARNAFRD